MPIVLLDEAYIHLSKTAEPGSPLVAADKDVIILRTFSKLYGMAGLRAGAALGRPDLLAKMQGYGAGALPVTGMVGAIASLKAKGLVEKRRKIIADIREETAEWLDKKGFAVHPLGSEHDHGRRPPAGPRGLPGACSRRRSPSAGPGRRCPTTCGSRSARARRWRSSGRRSGAS